MVRVFVLTKNRELVCSCSLWFGLPKTKYVDRLLKRLNYNKGKWKEVPRETPEAKQSTTLVIKTRKMSLLYSHVFTLLFTLSLQFEF